eukprot:scaffold19.g1840.t1
MHWWRTVEAGRRLPPSAAAAAATAGWARLYSAAAWQQLELPLSFPAVCIWGANTGIGKTLFSAGLAAACVRAEVAALYLKPVQTGFPLSSDAQLVARASGGSVATGPHAAALLAHQAAASGEGSSGSGSGDASTSSGSRAQASGGVLAKTLYAWHQAVSPHLAAETEGRAASDEEVVAVLAAEIRAFAAGRGRAAGHSGSWGGCGGGSELPAPSSAALVLVETAGGVASPGPSGALQADLLRSLRLPALLVGDGRLGGISATLTALDSLRLRGYDVPLVVLMDDSGSNQHAIQAHAGEGTRVLAFPRCADPAPADAAAAAAAAEQRAARVPHAALAAPDSALQAWLDASAPLFDRLLGAVQQAHAARLAALHDAASEGLRTLWWPFTQHGSVGGPDAVTVIDSRLVAAVAQAGGRYGHVMFPQNVHTPALALARRLLDTVGAGWASRVFYTDDGSTAVEVALKMAFRKFMADHGLLEEEGCQLEVLGLTEGYHGDTLGAMDAVAPTPYNGRLQTPWYSGRGLFLDPPSAGVVAGRWEVAAPATLCETANFPAPAVAEFASREEIFDPGRDASPLARTRRGIPVIFDEVFTGLWRLGAPSGAALLGAEPDIASYAKLLTGGLLPLAATLASPAVFAAFESDSKLRALLHGHSYSAHALGCAAGVAALCLLPDPSLNPNACTPGGDGRAACARGGACAAPCGALAPLWDDAEVASLSAHPAVARAVALGTVLALELRAAEGGGYASNAALRVVERLREQGVYARPLGNVAYLMVGPMAERGQCAALLGALRRALG